MERPPFSFWFNGLKGNETSDSENEHVHPQKVFVTIGCRRLGDYRDFCFKSGTLPTGCAVEEVRTVCLDTYGPHSVHKFRNLHLSGDMKTCEADL